MPPSTLHPPMKQADTATANPRTTLTFTPPLIISTFRHSSPLHVTPNRLYHLHSRRAYLTRCARRECTRHAVCTLEPVEDGVTLPKISSTEALEEESDWLCKELSRWLDEEWDQGAPQAIHAEIGRRTGQIYSRQRMEGEDDLSSVLIAIGSELEGMDFREAFVGPWNVANKTCELLLHRILEREVETEGGLEAGEKKGVEWSMEWEMREGRRVEGMTEDGDVGRSRAVAVNLADRFEKLRFLSDLLDGAVSKEKVNGVVGAAMGFRYNVERRQWEGSEVEDEHFRGFGDRPPDVLGDEEALEYTETLKYLEEMLERDDEDGKVAEGLDIVMETVHGVELYKVQREDEGDHAFHKRVVVAKWLHLYAGF